MEIGLSLPTTVPGADGRRLIEFARRAEQLGFNTVTAVDRLVYDNYDSITALAAAAAVTERVTLSTSILLAAYRPSVVELAKQLASVDRLSGGRLVLGLSSGMRADDYEATGTDHHTRGARLDSMITELRETWQGGGPVPGVGPKPVNGDIPMWIGGQSPAAIRRAAKHGIGWTSPGGNPMAFGELVTKVQAAWTEEGRTDKPKMGANCYVSLGPEGAAAADHHMRTYYAFMGEMVQHLAKGAVTDEARLRMVIDAYAANGCDQLFLLTCTADPDQVDLIAKVAFA